MAHFSLAHMLVNWVITGFAVLVASWIIPGVRINGFATALGVAAVFGILNALFGWLLLVVFGVATLGIGFLLAGITRWVVNTILLQVTDWLVGGFSISSWFSAGLASLVISLVSAGAHYLLLGTRL